MASKVAQQIVGPLIKVAAGGIQSGRLVRAQRSSSPRGSIQARGSCTGHCINRCAVPRARQFVMSRSSAAAPRYIHVRARATAIASTPARARLFIKPAQQVVPADTLAAASRQQGRV